VVCIIWWDDLDVVWAEVGSPSFCQCSTPAIAVARRSLPRKACFFCLEWRSERYGGLFMFFDISI